LTRENEKLIFSNCGTPGYLAPEIFQEKKSINDVNAKSDIFSMGVVFYILLTRKALFGGADWKEVLTKNRENRFEIEEQITSNQNAHSLLMSMLESCVSRRVSAEMAMKHFYLNAESMEEIMNEQENTSF
jgi:serine/threonine protein kinase